MKDNSYENIPVGFIIKPVHQDNKRKDTHDEVQTVLLLIVSVIIVVKERRLFFNRALE